MDNILCVLRRGVSLVTLSAGLVACGGGGSSPEAPDTAAGTLVGTAAIGAAAVNFSVQVRDRTGASACFNDPVTTDEQGHYRCELRSRAQSPLAVVTIDPTGLVPPMISLLPSMPGSGATATANVSPLTTAIAAQLAGTAGAMALAEPARLAALNVQALQTITTQVVTQLSPVLSSVGVDPATFDPFTTAFEGGSGTGADALLDQVRVSFDNGTPHLSNVLNPTAPPVPLANGGTSSPPAVTTSAVVGAFSVAELDFAKTELERCFAVPAAIRAPSPDLANRRLGVVAAECQGFVARVGQAPNVGIEFLNNGYGWQAYFYSVLVSEDMDGARFNRPELMRLTPFTDGRNEALLNIKFVDKNGFPGNRILSAKKFPGSRAEGDTQWWLIGNQRPIDAYIQVAMSRREQNILLSVLDANTFFDDAPRSRYEVGFNIYVHRPNNGDTVNNPNNPNNAIRYVRVTGPGLPTAGIVYADVDAGLPQSWMTIQNVNGGIPTSTEPWLAGNVGNIFRVQRTRGVSGTDAFTVRPNSGAENPTSDSLTQAHASMYAGQTPSANWIFDVSSVPSWSLYRFEVFCGTSMAPCHDFTTRISTPLPPASFLASMAWHSYTQASRAAVSDGAPAANDLLIAWASNPLAERVSSVNAYSWSPAGNVNSASVSVPTNVFSRTVTGVGGQFPSLSYSSNQSGRQMQLRYLMLDGSYKDHYSRFN